MSRRFVLLTYRKTLSFATNFSLIVAPSIFTPFIEDLYNFVRERTVNNAIGITLRQSVYHAPHAAVWCAVWRSPTSWISPIKQSTLEGLGSTFHSSFWSVLFIGKFCILKIMFRLNPLKVIRHLSEIGNVYHEVFQDDGREATPDETELAKKLKGKVPWQIQPSKSSNQSVVVTLFFYRAVTFLCPCFLLLGMIDVFLEPEDLDRLNKDRTFIVFDWSLMYIRNFRKKTRDIQNGLLKFITFSSDWLHDLLVVQAV